MTANASTSSKEESTDGSTEIQNTDAIESVQMSIETEIIQYADRQTDAEAWELAEQFRKNAEALEEGGYEKYRPGL